jgi:hypothetical protein
MAQRGQWRVEQAGMAQRLVVPGTGDGAAVDRAAGRLGGPAALVVAGLADRRDEHEHAVRRLSGLAGARAWRVSRSLRSVPTSPGSGSLLWN